jgi:perosamine synthetase
MWVRTQLKIDWRDLLAGLAASRRSLNRAAELRKVETFFTGQEDSIATYSVRSGFDLLLQALKLQPGDEVMFSALNVRVMVKVVKQLGLVPVPIDLDLETMGPRLDVLKAAITPRSKVFVAAHLFGSRINLDPAFAIAKGRGLLTVEDCAQAFNGRDYLGSDLADVAMYSFGPIKTATALGGGILRVRDTALLQEMKAVQSLYPVQSDKQQRKRIVKFLGLKAATSPTVLGAIYRYYKARGKDYEDSLANRVRDVAPLSTVDKMRMQCSAQLLWMMNRRLENFRSSDIEGRKRRGETLTSLLRGSLRIPGQKNRHHDYWVYPVLHHEPKKLIAALRENGFDAADLPRSQHIAAPEDRPELEPQMAANMMRDIVIVPCYADMSDADLKRQAKIVKQIVAPDQAAQ